jgi:hypothetical protein
MCKWSIFLGVPRLKRQGLSEDVAANPCVRRNIGAVPPACEKIHLMSGNCSAEPLNSKLAIVRVVSVPRLISLVKSQMEVIERTHMKLEHEFEETLQRG